MEGCRRIRFASPVILAGCMCLVGCSGPPPGGGGGGTPASVVYMWGFNAGNGAPQTILKYTAGSAESGDPLSTLQLPAQYTGRGLTTDSSNQLYVGVTNAASNSQVLVYADGASGAAVATRVIDVPNTPQCLFVDATGNLYVGASVGTNIVVSVYGADAAGQAVPPRTVQSPTNKQIIDIAADTAGNLYVAGFPLYDSGNIPYGFIDVYSPDATGSAEPERSISFPEFIGGVAVDRTGNVFVSVESSLSTGVSQANSVAVEEFAPEANGYATPARVINLPEQAVPAGESGSTGAGGGAVRFDGAGNIFTPEITGMGGSFNYVLYKIAPATSNPVSVAQINPENGYDFIFGLN